MGCQLQYERKENAAVKSLSKYRIRSGLYLNMWNLNPLLAKCWIRIVIILNRFTKSRDGLDVMFGYSVQVKCDSSKASMISNLTNSNHKLKNLNVSIKNIDNWIKNGNKLPPPPPPPPPKSLASIVCKSDAWSIRNRFTVLICQASELEIVLDDPQQLILTCTWPFWDPFLIHKQIVPQVDDYHTCFGTLKHQNKDQHCRRLCIPLPHPSPAYPVTDKKTETEKDVSLHRSRAPSTHKQRKVCFICSDILRSTSWRNSKFCERRSFLAQW